MICQNLVECAIPVPLGGYSGHIVMWVNCYIVFDGLLIGQQTSEGGTN